LLISVAGGLTLAWLTSVILAKMDLLPFQESARLGVMSFLALVYATLLLATQLSIMLHPINRLNHLLREMKSRVEIRQLNPTEFAELGPLLETTLDFMDWAENQQHVAAAIHHAFHKRIEDLAEYDALTNLYNYHYLKTILPLQIAQMVNLKDTLSVIMLDVDHFKHYNDTNGHPEGDRVLAKVAEILRNAVRERDICSRYGGEEFFITLPNASCERAIVIAERIRRTIEQNPFPHGDCQPLGRLTASLGVASFPVHASLADDLIKCADQALYLAKHRGRNRTCTYDDVITASGSSDLIIPVSVLNLDAADFASDIGAAESEPDVGVTEPAPDSGAAESSPRDP
jgi:diguanylate cyclase (GGDEF)-like protein